MELTRCEIMNKVVATVIALGILAGVLILVVTFEKKKPTIQDYFHDNKENKNELRLTADAVSQIEAQKMIHFGRKKREILPAAERKRVQMLRLTIEEDPPNEYNYQQEEEEKNSFNDNLYDSLINEYQQRHIQPEYDMPRIVNIRHQPEAPTSYEKREKKHHKRKKKTPPTTNVNSLTYIFANNSVYLIDRGQKHEPKNIYVYTWMELTTAAAAAIGLCVTIILTMFLMAVYCCNPKKKSTRKDLSKLFLNMRDLTTSVTPDLDQGALSSVITKSYIQLERNPSGVYLTQHKMIPANILDERNEEMNKLVGNNDVQLE